MHVSTKSVAVTLDGNFPCNLNPTTSGNTIDIVYPSITASASIPPTPHPVTPKPLIIVVWESVPTTESGNRYPYSSITTRAKYSKFT